MRCLVFVWLLGNALASQAQAVSFDDPLPPEKIQAVATTQTGKAKAEDVLAVLHPGYDVATHCAGSIRVTSLAMQELPYDKGTLAVAVKHEPCQAESGKHDWKLEAALMRVADSGKLVLLARAPLPEASGLQQDTDGGNDDAALAGFDFARYETAPGQRAFGLRWHAFSSGTGAATDTHNVTVCQNEHGVLRPVLTFAARETETDVSSPSSEEATSDTVTKVRVLRVLPTLTQGHYDWQVAVKSGGIAIYRWQGDHYEEASPETHKDVTAESVLRGMQ